MSHEQQQTTQSEASAATSALTSIRTPVLAASSKAAFAPEETDEKTDLVETDAVAASLSEQAPQASCAAALRIALRERDAVQCERLALQAGNQQDRQAVDSLVELLKRGSGRRTGRKNPQWLAARVAAARALGQVGDAPAITALSQAILDRNPAVQQAASAALLFVGAVASPSLIDRVQQTGNWPLEGMKTLIATLGRLQQPEAAAVLSRIILGELPSRPLRWKYPLIGIGIGALATLGTLLAALSQLRGEGGAALLGLIVVCLLFMPLLVLICLVIIIPLYNLWENREMQALAEVAGEALYAVRDRSVLPVIIAAAFGPQPPKRQQIARKALESLLPLLNAEDTDFFPVTSRTYLVLALGYSGDTLDLALLRALEFVGNGQAIPPVTRLAKYGVNPLIQQEAIRILPILHRRFEQSRTSSMLLRASDRPLTQGDQLLRASLVSAATPAEELLRPGLAEENGD